MQSARPSGSIGKVLRAFAALIFLALLAGCPHLQLIAEYDAKNFEETIRVAKSGDVFYGGMLEMPDGERSYAKFSARYVEIEADIRSLVQRNAARELNTESRRISETILGFRHQYRKAHQERDAARSREPDAVRTAAMPLYDGARLDRLRFNRPFTAAAAAEEAKKLRAGDRAPADG